MSVQPISSAILSLTVPVSAGSESHIAVLTNDSFWRLYHIDDLTVAEQTFELQLNPDRWDLSNNSKHQQLCHMDTFSRHHPYSGLEYSHSDFAKQVLGHQP